MKTTLGIRGDKESSFTTSWLLETSTGVFNWKDLDKGSKIDRGFSESWVFLLGETGLKPSDRRGWKRSLRPKKEVGDLTG